MKTSVSLLKVSAKGKVGYTRNKQTYKISSRTGGTRRRGTRIRRGGLIHRSVSTVSHVFTDYVCANATGDDGLYADGLGGQGSLGTKAASHASFRRVSLLFRPSRKNGRNNGAWMRLTSVVESLPSKELPLMTRCQAVVDTTEPRKPVSRSSSALI